MVLFFEEAATKHSHDFRQLKTEKKRLEKELKKAQVRLSLSLCETFFSIFWGKKEAISVIGAEIVKLDFWGNIDYLNISSSL